jgi:hypothetical protein
VFSLGRQALRAAAGHFDIPADRTELWMESARATADAFRAATTSTPATPAEAPSPPPTRVELAKQRQRLLAECRLTYGELRDRAAAYTLSPDELDIWHTIEGIDFLLAGTGG